MKGIVFTEFLEMVEHQHGLTMVDQLLDSSDLPSLGRYTAVGTYDHRELVLLVKALSAATAVPVPDLLRAFGRHLFPRFGLGYPELFQNFSSARNFLANIEDYIHREVRKLYPDAELPRFECTSLGENELEMVYRSSRPLADFAEGLIEGCSHHFGETIQVQRENLTQEQGIAVRFRLTFFREVRP